MKRNETYEKEDVFGISRSVPLTYIKREGVDDRFERIIRGQNHVVIFGSSKQGKTSLRQSSLSDDRYFVINCLNSWSLVDLIKSVLREAGFNIFSNQHNSSKLKIEVKAGIPGLSAKASEEASVPSLTFLTCFRGFHRAL